MKAFPAWVTYTVLRLLLIAVPLAILLILQLPWWLAAILAAVIGLCLSYLLLGKSRNTVSSELHAARTRRKSPVTADDAAEDAIVDASADGAASASRGSEIADDDADDASEREAEPQDHAVGKPGDTGQLKG